MYLKSLKMNDAFISMLELENTPQQIKSKEDKKKNTID